MEYTDNALNILTAYTYKGIGPVKINSNLKGNDDIKIIYKLSDTNEYEFQKKKNEIESKIIKLGDSIDGVVAIGDSNFPEIRGSVKAADKPFALFYKGDITLLNKLNKNIAVIGVLNPTEKVEKSEIIVTEEILKYDVNIVSGLALGCDTIAHKTALENNCKTIAILPSPLNDITPKENVDLANNIVKNGGLLITEYYEKPKGRNEIIKRLVDRDRLQALFSDVVLLAASYAPNKLGNDCGSRHAMNKAKDYGIKRAVIYNEIKHKNESMYDLNRQILSDDKSVFRIDSSNMEEVVRKMINNNTSYELLTMNFD